MPKGTLKSPLTRRYSPYTELRSLLLCYHTKCNSLLHRQTSFRVVDEPNESTERPRGKPGVITRRRETVLIRSLMKLNVAQLHEVLAMVINNYSSKWRWLAVDIYRAAKRRGEYPPLATDTEVNSCFSIY